MAGSQERGQQFTLRDGSTVRLAPLRRGDHAAVAAWFAALGPTTRYERFLGHVKRLDPRTLADLADVDHRDHEALAALDTDGRTVAIARYIRLPASTDAEIAVAVADDWRGRGLATLLLRELAATARGASIRRAHATCLASNETIIRLLRRLGPSTVSLSDANVVEVTIDLTSPVAGRGDPPALASTGAGRPTC